ncbi:MAG: helix-turn-helix domain-containing protein, partial [Myxococcota bacterium]
PQIFELTGEAETMQMEEIDPQDEIVPLAEVERRAILKALRLTGGNIKKAAESLKIGRATLYRKLEKYQTYAPSWEEF